MAKFVRIMCAKHEISGRTARVLRSMEKWPPWLLTVITVTAILWLTLASRPTGDIEIPLFPGADKIVHALMFGFLTFAILFDKVRRDHWHPCSPLFASAAMVASVLFGIGVEIAQLMMEAGRSYEAADMAADAAGAILMRIVWGTSYRHIRFPRP